MTEPDDDDPLLATFGAAMPNAAPKSLEGLRTASDPTTLPGVLAALSSTADASIRRAICANPNVPIDTLLTLAGEFPEEFFANPALALYLLENPGLFSEMKEEVLAKLVAHPDMPSGMLLEAARHRAFYVRRAAAQNPRMPPEVLVELAEKQSYFEEVAGNPSAPPALIAKLTRHDWPAVRRAAASNPALPPTAVAALANDGDAKVRRAVMRNETAATEDVLAALATDESPIVRLTVAECERTPVATLTKLEADRDAGVRFAAARTKVKRRKR